MHARIICEDISTRQTPQLLLFLLKLKLPSKKVQRVSRQTDRHKQIVLVWHTRQDKHDAGTLKGFALCFPPASEALKQKYSQLLESAKAVHVAHTTSHRPKRREESSEEEALLSSSDESPAADDDGDHEDEDECHAEEQGAASKGRDGHLGGCQAAGVRSSDEDADVDALADGKVRRARVQRA